MTLIILEHSLYTKAAAADSLSSFNNDVYPQDPFVVVEDDYNYNSQPAESQDPQYEPQQQLKYPTLPQQLHSVQLKEQSPVVPNHKQRSDK